MTTNEIEQLLEGGTETQRIDFKESCAWDVEKFAKDFLAFSNVRDGGYIIIGVNELESPQRFERAGISGKDRNSYKIDTMRDQMTAYADPHVNFNVDFPKDKSGTEYAVIHVFEFEEIPVICRKDGRDTKRAIVYYRNRDRRWESAAVSNSYDMRDIVERSAVKLERRHAALGLVPGGVPTQEEYIDGIEG